MVGLLSQLEKGLHLQPGADVVLWWKWMQDSLGMTLHVGRAGHAFQ